LLILEEFEWIGRGKGGGLLERERREFFLSNLERERKVEMNNFDPKNTYILPCANVRDSPSF
jgi:hypothetical protein